MDKFLLKKANHRERKPLDGYLYYSISGVSKNEKMRCFGEVWLKKITISSPKNFSRLCKEARLYGLQEFPLETCKF